MMSRAMRSMGAPTLTVPMGACGVLRDLALDAQLVQGGRFEAAQLVGDALLTPTGLTAVEAEDLSTPNGLTAVEAEGLSTPNGLTAVEAEGLSTPTGLTAVETEGLSTPTGLTAVETEGLSTLIGLGIAWLMSEFNWHCTALSLKLTGWGEGHGSLHGQDWRQGILERLSVLLCNLPGRWTISKLYSPSLSSHLASCPSGYFICVSQ
ncbi:hypothetical protein NHX12_030690 [Muraenolepis orangiensis]|uniref:Uncharacterized protein n=1 Tax=Muraenolepis orangiensis TaxID=630683 RepID=A0A9Q0EA01_9TELE|nr:hypothetical protein NHX12_030690 [Muraenolepis orangiensis]